MTEATSSLEPVEPLGVRGAAAARRTFPNGWWGMTVLIATEGALLACFFASYFYLRFRSAEWPQGGIEPPELLVPLVLVAVLVSTSVPMLAASAAARRGLVRPAWAALLVALLVQSGYLAFALHEYAAALDAFQPQDNAYASAYFTVLGAHHAHVVVGLSLNGFLLARLLAGLTSYRAVGVRAVAWYWHFTNAMAVGTTLTILSPSL